ncbi:hypothetical protein LTR48_003103 [Friedmanniomyces endolithicus]|uniref:MJ1316 RNA cyclic group end recognition domain-containing protein n=1 Tax=Rachicladosporium monterosium TaxID=1507873 RepID=A0ABR0L9E5_9PEZI|nr:hypothetical protein LTR48_003103 [Friedmanniomyces endolithicus]KAK5145453.1 hypothetical protein LTR32_002799 [Rachicladosporium monterosium]
MAPPTAPDVDQASMLANIHTLSLVLHAHYINFLDADWSTSAPHNMRPQRYLFPTSTLAADLWEPGEDIHLVCITEDRKTTFWAIVTSELHLEKERGWTLTGGTMTLDWPLLGISGIRAAKLAGSALYLHYALLPPQFSLDLLPHYGIPEYRRKDTVAYMPKHVDQVRHALHLTTALQSPPFATFPFLPTYRRLRRWAYALGLLGPRLGLLDGKTLLNLIFGACSGYLHHPTTVFPSHANFLESFFLQSASWLPAYSQALGATLHGETALLAALKQTCERLIARGGPGGSSLACLALDRITPAIGFQSFLSSYDYFLVLTAETWGSAETYRDLIRRRDSLPGLTSLPQPNATKLSLTSLSISDSTDESQAPIPSHMKRKKKTKTQLAKALPTPPSATQQTPTQPSDPNPPTPSTTQSSPSPAPAPAPAPSPAPTPLLPLPRILARLRWHPDYRLTRYEIGYRDRFLPELQWMPMEEWGRKATEEEDWIPGHRVMVIRAVGEGEGGVVWDRRGRGGESW